jgi:hypothetical protein
LDQDESGNPAREREQTRGCSILKVYEAILRLAAFVLKLDLQNFRIPLKLSIEASKEKGAVKKFEITGVNLFEKFRYTK